jgi:large subunit ribosomal protein L9
MKVIFIQDLPGKGKRKDIKEVRTGYARNYLIPKEIVKEATPQNIKILQEQEKKIEKKKTKIVEEAKRVKNSLRDKSITINSKAGQDDKLFGSVTTEDIASAIQQQLSIAIDKHQIMLEQPIKKLGIYKIPVRLCEEVIGEVKIWIVSEK